LRRPEELLFITPDLSGEPLPQNYEYQLSCPGEVVIHESGTILQAHRISAEARSAYNPDELLSAESLSGQLKVRNWRAGDRFWPAHTKSPKKIKELFQDHHVAAPERPLWPVVLSGDEIVWVRGLPVHAKFRAQAGIPAVRITERQPDEF
jgi:tRNA(Ile)-lysidine synthase